MKLFKSIIILAITLIATQAFSASIVVNPKFQAIDEDGAPLVGGCLYSYDCGTTSKAATCADYLCAADNTNPIELDARGEADVYSDQCFKLALYEADIDGVCDTNPSTTLIWTKDNIPSGNTGTAGDGTTVLSLGTDGTDAFFIGDIQANNGTEVLENGTDGSDSTYIGDIYATNGSNLVLNSGTDGTNANIEADINADDGTEVLENGTDGSNAIFTGSVVGNTDTSTTSTSYSNTANATNVGGGYQAFNALSSGSSNTALGYRSFEANATGSDNVAIGSLSLIASTGNSNTAVGYSAGQSILGASSNVAVGRLALQDLETGNNNTAVGTTALSNITDATSCAGVGYRAGLNNITGDGMSAFGYESLVSCTGDNNTGLGKSSGNTATTGSNNSFLGYNAQPSAVDVSNEITLGDTNIGTLRSQVALTVLSDERDKKDIEGIPIGLDFVNDLRPVKFTWDRRDGSKPGVEESGFIAQEVDAVEQSYNVSEFMHLIYKANPEKLEMTKANLLPVMVKAIQELSTKVKELESRMP